MPTTNTNRKILDLKRWEFVTPAPVTTAAGAFIASSRHYKQQQLYVQAATVAYLYNPSEDGWIQVPSPALANSLAAGAAGVATAVGPSGTASAGTTTTLTTNLTLARDLRGYSINFLSGSVSGSTYQIARNTIGANSVITISGSTPVAIAAGTTYRLLTPRWYVTTAGAIASATFRYYDYALNTWTTVSQTGMPSTIGTDSKLIATPSWMDAGYLSFATGSVTSATVNTITNSAISWSSNQWVNGQVRITAGTGAGQIRTILSSSVTAITASANWAVTPDATSQYSIEGNDDYIYYIGSAAVTLYRYSISANTWTTLTPGVARAGAPGAGMGGHWVWGATDELWTTQSAIQNGRYIYSFRGGGSAALDRYDIPANTWSAITYSPATETLTTGTKYAYNGDYIYIQKDATGRWFRHNVVTSEQDGWSTTLYTQGTAIVGDTVFDVEYKDGTTEIPYVYFLINTGTPMLRAMII
jgi:hypothetical protein